MDLETVSAFCLMPALMLVAAQGWTWLILVFTCLPFFLASYYYKVTWRPRFFLGWSLVSFFFLLGVFELEVVPYLEILFIENFILMCFVAVLCICIFFARSNSQPASLTIERGSSKLEQLKRTRCELCNCLQPIRSYHCDYCGVCIPRRDHHCVWLDTCIGSKNQRYYVGALVTLLLSCVYSSNLTLTTICHPTLVGGLLLLPDDCSDVFGDIHIAICFVSAVYTLVIAALAVVLLSLQLWFITRNTTFQEWNQGHLGLHSRGFCRNIVDFCYGYT